MMKYNNKVSDIECIKLCNKGDLENGSE